MLFTARSFLLEQEGDNDGSTVMPWYEKIYCENSNCLDEGCYKTVWHGDGSYKAKIKANNKCAKFLLFVVGFNGFYVRCYLPQINHTT